MSITYEEYIGGNNKYQIDKVMDSNGVYYNVYDKDTMDCEISFAYLKGAEEYIEERKNKKCIMN